MTLNRVTNSTVYLVAILEESISYVLQDRIPLFFFFFVSHLAYDVEPAEVTHRGLGYIGLKANIKTGQPISVTYNSASRNGREPQSALVNHVTWKSIRERNSV